MPRKVRDTKLDTRSARLKLPPRREPYWRTLTEGLAIGYRRLRNGGNWIARAYLPDRTPARSYEALGPADDATEADGAAVLTFSQAQDKARQWFARSARQAAGLEPAGGPLTVGAALDSYLDWYGRHRKSVEPTKRAVEFHIRPALGNLRVDRLTASRIKAWHEQLAAAPARLRSGKKAQQPNSRPAKDADARRQRKATANRVLTILKAALNQAWRDGRTPSDDAWRKVRPFQNVDAPVIRYLSAAETKRLANACPEDFRQLVRAALLTGCRYGELTSLQVSDINFDSGTVLIRAAKAGKPRHVILTDEASELFKTAAAGKAHDALVFCRSDGKAWGPVHQVRRMAEACAAAKISPAVSFHVLRHTHGSMLAMRGVPMAVIAQQLGHSDTRMTERHYAHLAPSYVADTIRQNFPVLGIVPKTKVKAIS